MDEIKVGELDPVATTNGNEQHYVDQGGSDRRHSTDQIRGYVLGDVTPTELGYVHGVTSAIQTQIDGKLDVVHTHTEGDITDLDHDAQKIKGKTVNDTDIADGKILKYNAASGNLEYETDSRLDFISRHYNASRSLRQKGFGLDIDAGAAATNHSTAANRYTIETPDGMEIDIGGASYRATAETEISLNTSGNWDAAGQTANYQTAANRAGKDFYVYAEEPSSGIAPHFILSANATVPDGNTPAGNARSAGNTRKIGGFHCLCVSVGDILNHALCDYVQGDILFLSVWDLKNRPVANPEGMVHSIAHTMTNADGESVVIMGTGIWVDIYLASGTGSSTASVNGATISDNRNWMDFVDDFGAVKKQLLDDIEFQLIAAGSNEETNITGSADPVTTGGHSDTAARRMISNIGCEDCCGALWQWLLTPSARLDDGTAGIWIDLAGAKGSFYTFGTNGDGNTQLQAGGGWANAAICGSRCRTAYCSRWFAYSSIGGRGRSQKL